MRGLWGNDSNPDLKVLLLGMVGWFSTSLSIWKLDLYDKEVREEILRGVWLTLKIMKQVYGLKRKKCLKLCHYLLLHTEIAGFTDESDFGVVGSD